MADQKHLTLLSILHFAMGALPFLILLIMFAANMLDPGGQEWPDPPTDIPDYVLHLVYWSQVFFWCIGGGLVIYSGRCLQLRQRRILSLIVAASICLLVPIGTLLGVYTIVILRRDSVRGLYAAKA